MMPERMQSTSSIPTIGENGLASNPRSISAEEANDRSNILYHGKTVAHAICLVEFHSFWSLLGIEESC